MTEITQAIGWTTTPEREALEREIASLIAEHVTIGYQFAPGANGLVSPDTIRVFDALGAASVVVHRLLGPPK